MSLTANRADSIAHFQAEFDLPTYFSSASREQQSAFDVRVVFAVRAHRKGLRRGLPIVAKRLRIRRFAAWCLRLPSPSRLRQLRRARAPSWMRRSELPSRQSRVGPSRRPRGARTKCRPVHSPPKLLQVFLFQRSRQATDFRSSVNLRARQLRLLDR